MTAKEKRYLKAFCKTLAKPTKKNGEDLAKKFKDLKREKRQWGKTLEEVINNLK